MVTWFKLYQRHQEIITTIENEIKNNCNKA